MRTLAYKEIDAIVARGLGPNVYVMLFIDSVFEEHYQIPAISYIENGLDSDWKTRGNFVTRNEAL